MAAPKCIAKDCTENALNVPLVLKTGGTAKCLYCAKHAVEKGFILPKAAAPAAPTAN